jgi:23S rRNA U2552 (ribose-2'-O)-methylase RlmE/FtsJ
MLISLEGSRSGYRCVRLGLGPGVWILVRIRVCGSGSEPGCVGLGPVVWIIFRVRVCGSRSGSGCVGLGLSPGVWSQVQDSEDVRFQFWLAAASLMNVP